MGMLDFLRGLVKILPLIIQILGVVIIMLTVFGFSKYPDALDVRDFFLFSLVAGFYAFFLGWCLNIENELEAYTETFKDTEKST